MRKQKDDQEMLTSFREFVTESSVTGYTEEMRDFFFNRTRNHIRLVSESIDRAMPHFETLRDELGFRQTYHDSVKFLEPEYSPYVWITWMYKCKKDGIPFEYPVGVSDMCNDATVHHVLTCKHHPEYWVQEAPISKRDRDSATASVDVSMSDMDDASIVEMVCDWNAVGIERGNTARSWFGKVNGTRFVFGAEREKMIERVLTVLENEKV